MAQVEVSIGDMIYDPDPVPVKKGDTVVWTNNDTSSHTATADDKSFDTGRLASGKSSKPILFNKSGTVPYHCTIHGSSMNGTVEVS